MSRGVILTISLITVLLIGAVSSIPSSLAADGTLKIIKVTSDAGFGDSFEFDIDGPSEAAFGASGVFSLDTDNPGFMDMTNIVSVTAGVYMITEDNIPVGWNIQNIVCTGNSIAEVINIITKTVTVTVSGGDDVVCTFNNFLDTDVDLRLIKDVDSVNPHVGGTVTYTISVENLGPDDATNVQVTDILPPGLIFVSAVPNQGSYNQVSGIWTVGSITPSQFPNLTITATVDSGTGGTIIVNTAGITAVDQTDSNTLNDFDDEIIIIATGIFDDVAKTFLNTPIAIDVLANDSDPDGDVLSFVLSQFPIITLENGIVTDNEDGTLTYSPLLDYVTPEDSPVDSFSYDVTDGNNIESGNVMIKVFDVPTYYAMEDFSDDLIIFDPDEDGDTKINFPFAGTDVTIPGRVVHGAYGLATNPLTDELYGLLLTGTLSNVVDQLELVKIDPLTGNGISIGIVSTDEDFAEITFNDSGILFGITGKSSSDSNQLHTISLIDASTNFVCSLEDEDDETVIGFNPNDGLIYHISGAAGSSGEVESVDVTLPNTCITTSFDVTGDIVGSDPYGFTFDVANDRFLMSDGNGKLHELKITSSSTAILNPANGLANNHGILDVDAMSFVSNDFDGILDSIDNDPGTFSNDFGDGSTTGSIENRGDQLVSVISVPGGIRISTDPSGGPVPAEIDDCENISNQSLIAGKSMIIDCGSITIKIITGPIDVVYTAEDGTTTTSTLNEGDNVTYEDTQSGVITNNGSEEIIISVNGGEPIPIGIGETVPIEELSHKVQVCHKGKKTLSISSDSLDDHLGHGDTKGACDTEDKPKKVKKSKK